MPTPTPGETNGTISTRPAVTDRAAGIVTPAAQTEPLFGLAKPTIPCIPSVNSVPVVDPALANGPSRCRPAMKLPEQPWHVVPRYPASRPHDPLPAGPVKSARNVLVLPMSPRLMRPYFAAKPRPACFVPVM